MLDLRKQGHLIRESLHKSSSKRGEPDPAVFICKNGNGPREMGCVVLLFPVQRIPRSHEGEPLTFLHSAVLPCSLFLQVDFLAVSRKIKTLKDPLDAALVPLEIDIGGGRQRIVYNVARFGGKRTKCGMRKNSSR